MYKQSKLKFKKAKKWIMWIMVKCYTVLLLWSVICIFLNVNICLKGLCVYLMLIIQPLFNLI